MGYDLTTVATTPFKKFDFNKCERYVRPAFVKEYKKKLLALVSNNATNFGNKNYCH